MAVGGNNWDDAGVLDLGSGNTFADTDALPLSYFWNDEGYWKFTLASPALVTIESASSLVGIDAYTGVFGPQVEVTYQGTNNGLLGPATFFAEAGVEHHVVAGKKAGGLVVPTYTLTFTAEAASVEYTPWSSDFRDRTDNELIISAPSGFSGELMDLNPEFDTIDNTHDFFYEVVESTGTGGRVDLGPPKRVGSYLIQEHLGGPDIDANPAPAATCAWNHAHIGHEGSDLVWSGACETLPATLSNAEDESPGLQPFYRLRYAASSGLIIAASVEATVRHVARGAWFLPVRDNLFPYGVLPLGDIHVADYLPEGYVGPYSIEWEDPYVDLVGVYVTADRTDRSTGDDVETIFHVNLDGDRIPGYGSGTWDRHWKTGLLGVEIAPPPPTRKVRFTGGDTGAASWHHLDAIIDWTDCASYPDDNPDAIIGMELDLPTEPALNTSATGNADVAFKFVLRASRFRVRYLTTTPTVTTVVRQWPRDDIRGVSSAPRVWPPTRSIRIAGGYPGGSNA